MKILKILKWDDHLIHYVHAKGRLKVLGYTPDEGKNKIYLLCSKDLVFKVKTFATMIDVKQTSTLKTLYYQSA